MTLNDRLESDFSVNGNVGVGLLTLSVGFFWLLNSASSYFPFPNAVSKKKDKFRSFRWQNLVISLCHAIIVAAWSSYCLLYYFGDMWNDMVLYCNWPLYALSCFTTGYFIHDLIDIYRHGYAREKWDIYVHHTAIIASAAYVIINVECVCYQILGIIAEINTVFLHARQLFHLAETPKSSLPVKLNTNLNIVSFVVFRFPPMFILLWGVTFDGHRVPIWYVSYYTFCLLTLTLMNSVLLYRLIVADFMNREDRSLKSEKNGSVKSENESTNSENLSTEISSNDIHVETVHVAAVFDDPAVLSNGFARNSDLADSKIRFRNNVIKDVNHLNEGFQRKLIVSA